MAMVSFTLQYVGAVRVVVNRLEVIGGVWNVWNFKFFLLHQKIYVNKTETGE